MQRQPPDHINIRSSWIFLLPPLLLIVYYVQSYFRSGLRHIPGPRVAAISRLWRVVVAARGHGHMDYQNLHAKYGPIVRTGPNHISIGDPAMISEIYGINSKYPKSPFYTTFTTLFEGTSLENLFSTQNQTFHKSSKRSVAQKYSLSSLLQLEPMVDNCSTRFSNAMEELCGQEVDLGVWLQWYAFDVIGSITFLQEFGFIERREDYRNIIEGIEFGLWYCSTIGQVPELHSYLLGNVTVDKLLSTISSGGPMTIVSQMAYDAIYKYDKMHDKTKQRGDFLEYLRMQQGKDGERMTDRDIMNTLCTNLLAGSDTTAISLRSVFYYVLKNESTYEKLLKEIDDANREGSLSPSVSYEQGSKLPYLQAVIKEALRIHPGVGLPLERIVPPAGATLCSRFVPGGTYVGINAWVIHRSTTVFGPDPDTFRPERWLESNSEQLKLMERTFFTFGHGSRSCIGKNISLMEMTKFVTQILRDFHIEWAAPASEWEIKTVWFVKQTGMVVRFRSRKSESTASDVKG